MERLGEPRDPNSAFKAALIWPDTAGWCRPYAGGALAAQEPSCMRHVHTQVLKMCEQGQASDACTRRLEMRRWTGELRQGMGLAPDFPEGTWWWWWFADCRTIPPAAPPPVSVGHASATASAWPPRRAPTSGWPAPPAATQPAVAIITEGCQDLSSVVALLQVMAE